MLDGCPYLVDEEGWRRAMADVAALEVKVGDLRSQGTLTDQTLRAYYNETRLSAITESNALEGSPLNLGETKLAVLQGITVSGHDPAYSRDAIALGAALDRVVELARARTGADLAQLTDLTQLKDLHGLILGERPSAGTFRTEPVRISGAAHRPPRTWAEVMDAMEQWEGWSRENAVVSPLLRAAVLHTWLTHVHPFLDGNGRTARAILNLELIRAGYPSVIIRHKDRGRYLEALSESDAGGDLGPMLDLLVERSRHAINRLEYAAREGQGYDQMAVQRSRARTTMVALWNDAVRLLHTSLLDALERSFGHDGRVAVTWYNAALTVDDFNLLSQDDSEGNSWLFHLTVDVPGFKQCEYLAWTGFRSEETRNDARLGGGPSIYWSIPDLSGHHKWTRAAHQSPGVAEITLDLPDVDRWVVRTVAGNLQRVALGDLVREIVSAVNGRFTFGDDAAG